MRLDVDEEGRLGQPELDQGDEAVAAGQDLRFPLAVPQDPQRLVQRARTDVFELTRDHALLSLLPVGGHGMLSAPQTKEWRGDAMSFAGRSSSDCGDRPAGSRNWCEARVCAPRGLIVNRARQTGRGGARGASPTRRRAVRPGGRDSPGASPAPSARRDAAASGRRWRGFARSRRPPDAPRESGRGRRRGSRTRGDGGAGPSAPGGRDSPGASPAPSARRDAVHRSPMGRIRPVEAPA